MSEIFKSEMNMGPQPIDALLAAHDIGNHDVVAADATRGATHKAVGKARKGRRLTARMQRKILAAVNHCLAAKGAAAARFEQLFNYIGP
ncbi:MAG: hypothetical protein KA004_13960 [Verrucomicrobiales bacterium]|nr:hypothetical protein [Verrucomicrobiales bacterium]